jgi:pantoate--beta-alanine ligase
MISVFWRKPDAPSLFLPSVNEIYPEGYQKKKYELGLLEQDLEGKFRPGHFQGVCEVVDRLLQLVRPENLYMGQKDFQQCMVVKKLLELLQLENSIQLHIVPTVREKDGLAMSSRNHRLTEEQREKASVLYNVLSGIKNQLRNKSSELLITEGLTILKDAGFETDYLVIRHADDLSPATMPDRKLVALVAAFTGSVRLIDNLILND